MVVLGLVLVEVEMVVIGIGIVDVKIRFDIEDGVGVAPDEHIPVADARFELRSRSAVLTATM